MQEQHSDFELIENFLKGDEWAFNILMKKYLKKIYMLARRMTGNHLDADEIVQEVLFAVYSKLHTFKFESKFGTWIYRITLNKSLNFIQKRSLKNILSIFDFARDKSKEADPLEKLEGKEKFEIVEKMLTKLPPKQREIFILKNFEGLDYKQISEITGKSIGTLKANYFHSLNKLKSYLNDYEKK